MKKNKNKSNVIPFPNLEKRLTEKGMEALNNKNFKEALNIFEQVSEITGNPEIEIGMVLCLIELGQLETAKLKCEKMLKEDTNDYYQLLQIYVTILIQLGNYQEVQNILEAVMNEEKLPASYAENLFKILELSRKMNMSHENKDPNQLSANLNQILNNSNDLREQWDAIQSLRGVNLYNLLSVLGDFLQNSKNHPVLKTMILELLKDCGITKEVKVKKFGDTRVIKPAELQTILEQPFTNEVLSLLDEELYNENPTLFEVVKEIWLRHLFVLYPFLPFPELPNNWAAALHKIGNEMHGIDVSNLFIQQNYHVSENELEECYKKILEIEEISFLVD